MTLDINFIKKFEENFSHNVNLSNYSWFNLGGNAEYFFKAQNKKQLIELAESLLEKEVIFKEDLKKIFGERQFSNTSGD